MFDTLIDTNSLQRELENPDLLICDCRYDLMNISAGRSAYLQLHIPGAIYLGLNEDLSGPPITNKGRHPLPTEPDMNDLFSRIGLRQQTLVVAYDGSGGSFAARLWWMLRHMQHEHVAVLDGGWQAWVKEGRPMTAEPTKRLPSKVDFRARNDDVVLIEEVTGYDCLVDSRDAARYRGEIEPIDKVAGHIPGAINRFWKENLNENLKFKSKEQLRAEFMALFGSRNAETAVFYCGSGVTACHNILAACYAGFNQPKLYAGSWSEWSTVPACPVAT